MKHSLVVAVVLMVLAPGVGQSFGKPAIPAPRAPGAAARTAQPAPARDDILALADKYTSPLGPELTGQDRQTVAAIEKTVEDGTRAGDVFFKQALDTAVSRLTLSLASARSLAGVTIASAYLVTQSARNRRVLNLFGTALHTREDGVEDAIAVFEYALALDPPARGAIFNLLRLNLANCYLDADRDEDAMPLLTRLEVEDAGNKSVYRALATYWYRKKNMNMFRQYLLKAATFKGYKKKKVDKQQQRVDEHTVQPGEPIERMELKLQQLQHEVPLSTADILEDEFPEAARQIRDKYGRLAADEKWILPRLPMVNVNGPPDYEKNWPVIEEWMTTGTGRLQVLGDMLARTMGVDPGASEAKKEKQAKAAGKQQMSDALRQAQQMLAAMKNIPGVSAAEIAEARRELAKAAEEERVETGDAPADPEQIPGADSGSLFALENYRSYMAISQSYFQYFLKYYNEHHARVIDIHRVFDERMREEAVRWKPEADKLEAAHRAGLHHQAGAYCIECRKAEIVQAKRLNAISDDYYRQWSNLYLPQYAKVMKPTLDAYYNVCMLYIRNMHDPQVMAREYRNVVTVYLTYAGQAIGGIGAGNFPYHPGTDEEQFELDHAIAVAREEAQAKKPEFERDFKSPEFDFTKWVDDHFVLEVSGEFLGLNITAHSIEFEAYLPGVGAGAKYDFSEEKFETYTGFGGKLKMGVNICGLEMKAEAKGDFYRRTAIWDLSSGKYSETNTAVAEAKAGPLAVEAEAQLDGEITARVTAKLSVNDVATIQTGGKISRQ